MLPLRDDIPHSRPPVVCYTLIAVNVVVFLFMATLSPASLQGFLQTFAVTPTEELPRLWSGQPTAVLPFLTNMFLHGGWLHLGSNMLFLYIFGDNVEDRFGHGRFLVFYLLCGVLASFAHAFFNPHSALPSLGASGAIAGVLAAYLRFFPQSRILTLVFLGFFVTTTEIPAVIYLLIWIGLQVVSGIANFGATEGGVAWWAHIGGFAAGYLLSLLMVPAVRQGRGR